MGIHQLKAFQQLAQTGNFTLAEKKLFLTHPAVSQQIKYLEASTHREKKMVHST